MAEYVMAIDAGTTGITVMLLDHAANIAEKTYSEFPQHFPQPSWVEHDPEEIWQATEDCISQILQKTPASAIAAIGITNQRETTVVWEKQSLRPVHNAIVWQCRRSAPICEELKSRGLEEEIRSRTGLIADPYFSGTKLTWLFREIDGLSTRAARGELAFGTVDSWLIAKLTGGDAHLTDYSNASRTLIYNIHEKEWDEKLLKELEIPGEILPDVVDSSGRMGTTQIPGISSEIPISGVAGDQQAALFGQACFEKGMSKNTYGTGSFVLTNMGSSSPSPNTSLLSTIAWGIGGNIDYALEGSIFITGAAIQWLRDGLGIINEASEAGPLAESVPGTEGVFFVPALVGLGAPHWDPYARGAIVGITRGTTKAHLARAAVEAMAYQTRDVVEAAAAGGVSPTELRVDGGAAVMDILCQFQADILGFPVVRPALTETTAAGAAYLAGIAESFWSSGQEVSENWKIDRTFEPQMDKAQRDELYSKWTKAVDRSKSWASPASPP